MVFFLGGGELKNIFKFSLTLAKTIDFTQTQTKQKQQKGNKKKKKITTKTKTLKWQIWFSCTCKTGFFFFFFEAARPCQTAVSALLILCQHFKTYVLFR